MSIDKNKVRELYKNLESSMNREHDRIIERWLEQNQPEPVFVGLSDKQVFDLAEFIHKTGSNYQYCATIKNWLETQTFTQSNESLIAINRALEKEVIVMRDKAAELKIKSQDELEQLKSQQFTPNWDDIPYWVEWLAIDDDGMQSWYELEPYMDECFLKYGSDGRNEIVCNRLRCKIFKRPKPTPQIEVGQVWCYTKDAQRNEYSIKSLGKVKNVENVWVDSVTYRLSQVELDPVEYTRTLSDFLANFERVG